MANIMHRLLLNPYLLPLKSCKKAIEKTTLLQIFVEDHDVGKFIWQCLDEGVKPLKCLVCKEKTSCIRLYSPLCWREEESLFIRHQLRILGPYRKVRKIWAPLDSRGSAQLLNCLNLPEQISLVF